MSNGELWLGTEQSAFEYQRVLRHVVEKHGSLTALVRADGDDDEEEPENPVPYQLLSNGILLLNISGSTISTTLGWTRYYGLISYQDIKERIAQAADDPAVKLIVLVIDSPGGQASGVKPLAQFIRQVSRKVKPIISFTEKTMASAAVWYGTAADGVYADEDARVGSIGVFLVHMEYVDYFKKEGLTPTVFRTAPYKALGNPYEKLSDKARAEITKEMNEIHERFVNGVALNRSLDAGVVSRDIANGRVFNANEALSLKLIDNVLPFDQVVAKLSKALDNTSRAAAV